MRPLKKIKMNRFLKVISSLALIIIFAACKKDDDSASITPPRDYAVQYATEKVAIQEYLENHYIASVDADYNIDIQPMPAINTGQISIWDQTVYPLLNKIVNSNGVDYTVYYLVLREGVGESPSKYDEVLTAYRGFLLNGTQFDYNPFPQHPSSLLSTIEAWQEIIPLFKTGTLVDIPNDPNPATFENYGAGVMFAPSGLAYYNAILPDAPAYSTMIFSFKLYDMERVDHDSDGILTINETVDGVDPADYDTDSDGVANFLDKDDDNDSYLTKNERIIFNANPEAPVAYYEFTNIPTCTGGALKRHLDPACHADNE